MRLDTSGNVASISVNAPAQSSAAVSSGRVSDSSANETVVDTHTAAPDLQRLIAAARQLPDVRPDQVEQAAAKLVSAELLSHEAAAQTATVIYNLGQ